MDAEVKEQVIEKEVEQEEMEEPVSEVVQEGVLDFAVEKTDIEDCVLERNDTKSMEVETSPVKEEENVKIIEEEGTFCGVDASTNQSLDKKENEMKKDLLLGKIETQENYVPTGVGILRSWWKKIFG